MSLIRRILLTLASLALIPLPAGAAELGSACPRTRAVATGTCSILTCDPAPSELGGAVQSRVVSVGTVRSAEGVVVATDSAGAMTISGAFVRGA